MYFLSLWQFFQGKIGKIPEHLGPSWQLLIVGLSTWQNLMFDFPKKNIYTFLFFFDANYTRRRN